MSIARIRGTDGNFKGIPSLKGDTGAQGVSVTGSSIDASGHLILTLSDGSTVDAGALPSAVNDIDTISGVLSCDAIAHETLSGLSTTKTAVLFNSSVSSKYEAYVCITPQSALPSGSTITVTPAYGAIEYSDGAVSGVKANEWVKLNRPQSTVGSNLTAMVGLTLSSGSYTGSVNVAIRYISTTTT